MLTPPFDHVAFLVMPDSPPSTSKGRDDQPPPKPILTLGRAIGMTADNDGQVWLYIEPADADYLVVRVALDRCRRACPPEVYEHDRIRRCTADELFKRRCADFAAQAAIGATP